MAGPANCLEAVRIVGVLSRIALQRHDVVALQAPGTPALNTTPAVAREDLAAHSGPAVGIQSVVVSAHVLFCGISLLRGR